MTCVSTLRTKELKSFLRALTNKLMNQKGFVNLIVIIGVIILVGAAGYLIVNRQTVLPPTPVACTQEAKLCPDGSYVGRTGPNCEFALCPSEALCEGGECPPTPDGEEVSLREGQREGPLLVASNDIGLAFQLGVIYYRLEELEKARDEFERAKVLNVGYSNARYMLGLVYDRLGRKSDAEAEFLVVLELNPNNQEVRDILANLEAGLPALAGIDQPGQPPIQETPPEIGEEDRR